MSRRAELRVFEASEGVDRLLYDFDKWSDVVSATGHLNQYATQLTTLGNILRPTLVEVRRQLIERSNGLSLGEIYDQARMTDIRVAFCYTLWRWFGDRFDQRLDPQLRPALLAADEVIWSSWERLHRNTGRTTCPAPLPAIDGSWVAKATARVAPPRDIRAPNNDALLRECAKILPIPVIGLPPLVVRRPWWLVVAVHETGHHVQYEFGTDLVSSVAKAVRQAVKVAGGEVHDAQDWANWSHELFADAFSVALAGAGAVWAIEELEMCADKDLITPRRTYPPPVTRLSILRRMLERSGVPPGEQTLRIPNANTATAANTERARILEHHTRHVVEALFSVDIGGTTLSALSANAITRRQRAALWRDDLLKKDAALSPVQTLDAARECVSGAVWAWQQSSNEPDMHDVVARLRERILVVLPECREDSVRAVPSVPQVDNAVRDLIDVVLHIGDLA